MRQSDYDQQISNFFTETQKYIQHLKKHLDTFSPLSNEDEEYRLKHALKNLDRYRTDNLPYMPDEKSDEEPDYFDDTCPGQGITKMPK